MQEEAKQRSLEEPRRFTKVLKVPLVTAEKIAMAEELASSLRTVSEKKDELDSIKSRYNSDIKELESRVSSLAERLNSGWEMKAVQCEEYKDWATFSVRTFRMDTMEILEERAMTAEERQPPLPLEAPDESRPA